MLKMQVAHTIITSTGCASSEFLLSFGLTLLAFYQECHLLIGYAAHYLFCCRYSGVDKQCALVNNSLAAVSLQLQSVCEEER